MDNHKFMLERHLYSTEFFTFIVNIVQALKTPHDVKTEMFHNDDREEPLESFYYKDYKQISETNKEIYKRIIDILSKFTFEVLAHAHENGVIII